MRPTASRVSAVTTALVSTREWSRRSETRLLVATALTAWAVANGPILADPSTDVMCTSLFVAAYVTVGMGTWWSRPGSRLGSSVAGAGFLSGSFSLNAPGVPLAGMLGMVVWAACVVYGGCMCGCYPGGRLESRLEREFGRSRSSDRRAGSSRPPCSGHRG